MSDVSDGHVVHLPPPLPHRQPHVFGEAVTIPPEKSSTGYEHKEKHCKNCGAVRVTVLGSIQPGRIWRGWRRTADAPLIETDVAPSCPQPSKPAS